MFCYRCGTKNKDDAYYCVKCGSYIQEDSISDNLPENKTDNLYETDLGINQQTITNSTASTNTGSSSRNREKSKISVIGILGIITIVGMILVITVPIALLRQYSGRNKYSARELEDKYNSIDDVAVRTAVEICDMFYAEGEDIYELKDIEYGNSGADFYFRIEVLGQRDHGYIDETELYAVLSSDGNIKLLRGVNGYQLGEYFFIQNIGNTLHVDVEDVIPYIEIKK